MSDVVANPRRFAELERGVRKALVSGFPYAILFAERPSGVLILAVMRGHRHPAYWRERLGG